MTDASTRSLGSSWLAICICESTVSAAYNGCIVRVEIPMAVSAGVVQPVAPDMELAMSCASLSVWLLNAGSWHRLAKTSGCKQKAKVSKHAAGDAKVFRPAYLQGCI